MKKKESVFKCVVRVTKECIHNPYLIFDKLSGTVFTNWIKDEMFLKLCYKAHIGKKLNLENPVGFNEKLQWLKLYDAKPEYSKLVDKYEAKNIIKKILGEDICIPTIKTWDNAKKIDLDELPDRFVLKCTHDSGGVIICKSKDKFDLKKAQKNLNKKLKKKYYLHGRELIYKDVKPRIIAEEYIDDGRIDGICDYKIMCFNGEPRCIFTCTERQSDELRVTFFDLDWNVLPFERHYKKSVIPIEKPNNLEKMIEFARILAKDTIFVRVDFYEVDNHILFGEMTFYPGDGFEEFNPEKWDDILGSWITLPI